MKLLELLLRIVFGTISEWWQKRKLRRKLREGLGHEVADMELTSLSTWMKMPSRDLRRPDSHQDH